MSELVRDARKLCLSARQEWSLGKELGGIAKPWDMLTTCKCQTPTLNVSYKCTGNMAEGSMERLFFLLNEASVSHLHLGQLFLSSGAGLRSLTTCTVSWTRFSIGFI